jgi:hypothetical protein
MCYLHSDTVTLHTLHYSSRNCNSSVNTVTLPQAHGQGIMLCFQQRHTTFLVSKESRVALESTQLHIPGVERDLSPRVKRQGHEADHSPLSSVLAKNKCRYTLNSPHACFMWCLIKGRDSYTFIVCIIPVMKPKTWAVLTSVQGHQPCQLPYSSPAPE